MLAIVGALFAATTSAATMYGFTNENPAVMLNVDAVTPSSANTVVIGTAQFGIGGAAWNPKDGKLYAMLRCAQATVTNTSSACLGLLNTLVTIDPTTGQIVDNFGQCTGALVDGEDRFDIIGSLEIDLDGKLYGTTGCSASPRNHVVFITITSQKTCTYTLGPGLNSAIGNNCMNGLAVNDKNEMFLLAPGDAPFAIYQIDRTTGAIIKSLGGVPGNIAGVGLNWINRLKFNPDVSNEAWVWWYPIDFRVGGVQGTNGFLKFTLTTDGVSDDAQFFDINYPYDADSTKQNAAKRVNAFVFERPPCAPCVDGVCECKSTCPQPDGTRCDDGRGTTHTDICVDNTCTSCADRKQCADPKDISLTLPDSQLICGDVADPDSNCRAPNLKINGWNSSTLTNANGQSVALTTDFTGCYAPTFANNTLVGFTNAQNGHSIVLSRNGQCWLKFIKPVGGTTKRNALQATTTTVTISAAHLLPAVGGATGDPHITGPRGEHFEFQGRRAARYTMISGPKYFINTQMSVEQGDVHFMTQVHVRVGDVEFTAAQLSLFDATEKDLAPLNAKLAPHSANVTVVNRRHNGIVPLPPQLVLNLCGGQERIIVTAVKPSQRQVTAFHLFETTLYYNIEFEVAGCHDELDGVIGQLYQCKYNAQPFVYDAAVVEQRFAVENFDDVPASFKPRASCLRLQAHEDIVGGVAAFN